LPARSSTIGPVDEPHRRVIPQSADEESQQARIAQYRAYSGQRC